MAQNLDNDYVGYYVLDKQTANYNQLVETYQAPIVDLKALQ